MPTEVLENYISEADLARELGICQRTLKRWRSLREAPPVTRLGKRVLYERGAVAKWLKSREMEAA